MPAATLYFRDPDGNLLEYLTMLDETVRDTQGLAGTARSPSPTGTSPGPSGRTDLSAAGRGMLQPGELPDDIARTAAAAAAVELVEPAW